MKTFKVRVIVPFLFYSNNDYLKSIRELAKGHSVILKLSTKPACAKRRK